MLLPWGVGAINGLLSLTPDGNPIIGETPAWFMWM